MKYSIKELTEAFETQKAMLNEDTQRYFVVTSHSISADRFNKLTHVFRLSTGNILDDVQITLMENIKEQKQMKPGDIITQEKKVFEQAIREACNKFVDATGVAVQNIDVHFISTQILGKPYETYIDRVSVYYADV